MGSLLGAHGRALPDRGGGRGVTGASPTQVSCVLGDLLGGCHEGFIFAKGKALPSDHCRQAAVPPPWGIYGGDRGV